METLTILASALVSLATVPADCETLDGQTTRRTPPGVDLSGLNRRGRRRTNSLHTCS